MCSHPKPCGGPEDVGGCAKGFTGIHTARDRLILTAAIDGLERGAVPKSITYIYPFT